MENSKKLFEIALQLEFPWLVTDVKFTTIGKTSGQLDIFLDFPRGEVSRRDGRCLSGS